LANIGQVCRQLARVLKAQATGEIKNYKHSYPEKPVRR
jgi:hypothetical protein